jgi:O-acetyl-ADP-ribose deacetylase (regulator of RNase III)
VIHARAASYLNDEEPEKYLGLAVTNTLRVAQASGIKTLAMPAMGTGVFKFPPELAAEIIMKALKREMQEYPDIDLVRICVVDECMKSFFNQFIKATQVL